MKILFLYTKRMLAANKARTAVTFAGIVLSFALLTAVLTGTSSLFHFFSEYMKMRDGDYYGVIYNCDEEDEALGTVWGSDADLSHGHCRRCREEFWY